MNVTPSSSSISVDDGDVRMLEGGGGLGLLDEAALAAGIGNELGGKDFERHFAVELHVARAIHDAHAAPADLVRNLIVGERPALHSFSSSEEVSVWAGEKSKTAPTELSGAARAASIL